MSATFEVVIVEALKLRVWRVEEPRSGVLDEFIGSFMKSLPGNNDMSVVCRMNKIVDNDGNGDGNGNGKVNECNHANP